MFRPLSFGFVISALVLFACSSEKSSTEQSVPAESNVSAPQGIASAKAAPDGEEEAVLAVVMQYRDAILASQGTEAASTVTQETIATYERYRNQALTAERTEVEALGATDRLTVLLIRARMDMNKLRKMNGNSLLVHAIDQGWVGKASVSNLDFGDVYISGDAARVEVSSQGKGKMNFHVLRENGEWKFDLNRLMADVDPALMQMLRQMDPDPNEAILQIIRQLGAEVGPEIWIPAGA